jgi:hypothetical protein
MRESSSSSLSGAESPPPDAIWTVDRILTKPPQAPFRCHKPSSHTSNDLFQIYYDVRNEDEELEGEDYEDEVVGDVDVVYRMILPSRKLFADDDDGNETEMMSDDERNTFSPVLFNERNTLTTTRPPSVLVMPRLVSEESVNNNKTQPVGYNESNHPFHTTVVEEDDETSTSDDSLSCYGEFNIPHPFGLRDEPIFRRLEHDELNDEYGDVFRLSSQSIPYNNRIQYAAESNADYRNGIRRCEEIDMNHTQPLHYSS